ncbi:MAG TPA: hypothetical protein VNT79_03985, partial [Phycisphaerae bacterium]|nr:hypothetical protein [Phycisphaerae bacterium]
FTLFGIRLSILDFGGLALPPDHNSVRANFSPKFSLFHPARAPFQVVQGRFVSLASGFSQWSAEHRAQQFQK